MSFVCKYGFWNCKCQYSRVPSGLHHKLLFAHGEHFIAVFVGLVPAETERSFGTEIADVAVKTRTNKILFLFPIITQLFLFLIGAVSSWCSVIGAV